MEHELSWWTGQALGIVAFIITGIAFFQKDEKKLKTILTISGLFWMANFWFLGSYTSFLITLINTIRQLVSRVMHDSDYSKKIKLTYLFVIITILGGVLSWQSWVSFFPICAAVITTVSLFLWEAKKMRKGLLISECFWTVNNLHYLNTGGLLANTLNIPLLIYHIVKKVPTTLVEKDS